MKWFCILLCVFTIYMISLPCKDGGHHCTHFETSNTSTGSHHSEDNSPIGSCSPFCVCSCCSVTVIVSNIFIESKPITTYQEITPSNIIGQVVEFPAPIWQPPKIS